MEKIINRDIYLSRLIDKKENGLIKVITGIRRCGKSYLLFYLFRDYLISSGVKEEQIISIALDDDICEQYRNPDELSKYIRSRIVNKEMYYILIDEVQYAITKKELENPEDVKLYNVLNGLMRLRNVDIYEAIKFRYSRCHLKNIMILSVEINRKCMNCMLFMGECRSFYHSNVMRKRLSI